MTDTRSIETARIDAVTQQAVEAILARLSAPAWSAREYAHLLGGGKTKVGCAVLDEQGRVYSGTNIQHRFRSHDIHAEISAISALVSSGGAELRAILIAAERELFTPCGSCMDWIMQFGGPECVVGVQSAPHSSIKVYRAGELMPFYPR